MMGIHGKDTYIVRHKCGTTKYKYMSRNIMILIYISINGEIT